MAGMPVVCKSWLTGILSSKARLTPTEVELTSPANGRSAADANIHRWSGKRYWRSESDIDVLVTGDVSFKAVITALYSLQGV